MELEGLFEDIKETLPEGFKMPDIEKFDGTGNPKNHVRMCMSTFQSRGLSPNLMAMLFQQTLTGAALAWYFTLDVHVTKSWEGVVKAFVVQYEYNQELDITIRDLETTRQEYKESFAGFLTRWRNKAAKMVQRPSEKDQVRLVIKNLQPVYQEKMMFQALNTFSELFDVGTRIEDAIRDGVLKREDGHARGKRPVYNPGNHSGVADVNALSQERSEYKSNEFQENRKNEGIRSRDVPQRKFSNLGIFSNNCSEKVGR